MAPANRGKGSFRFRREEHLKGRNEIREVFKSGRVLYCRGAKLYILKNNLSYNRICFTFSRGFGNAVSRNRSRRLSREAFRLLRPRLSTGNDLIFLVFPEESKTVKSGSNSIPNQISDKKPNKTRTTLDNRAKQLEFLFSKAWMLK
ncbi:MAG: ribonuclease P protein component [Treponema sp.]|jgi:ribonuclease P protein component|nr:ribonuclease P protein component [Treponema sp.]